MADNQKLQKLLLNVACLLVLLATLSNCNCPLHGCTTSCSFSSEADFVSHGFQPKLLWSWHPSSKLRPSGAGCVTNAARIVCPMMGDHDSTLVSWDAVDDGQPPWNVSLGKKAGLPVMDISGGLIASDGRKLIGYQCDGVPLGKAILLFPVNGHLFDLTLVNSKVVLMYKCGFFVAYLPDGIPHASFWLNDTIHGENGTFIPLNNPASQGKRMYILAAFRPHSATKSFKGVPYLRLFAIDIKNTMIQRIVVAWFYDIHLSDISIPYINSIEAVCSSHYPPGSQDDELKGNRHTSADSKPVADIVVNGNAVAVVLNYNIESLTCTARGCFPNKEFASKSYVVVVQDQGTNFSVTYSKEFPYPYHAAAFNIVSKKNQPNEQDTFWISFFDVNTNQSILMEFTFSSGEMITSIDVAKLLGADNKTVNITSELTFLHYSKQNTSVESNSPLVFGVLVDNSKSFVVALSVSVKTGELLWTLDLGEEPCVGQISTVDRASDSLLITTSQVGVFVYLLTDL